MTILRGIQLHNFAQHANFQCELGSGLTTIVGAMGTGKTNLIYAAIASAVNDFSGFPGAKPSLIRRGTAGRNASSFCRTMWELEDKTQIEITRYLKGGSSTLFINGEDSELRREGDITQRVETLLGVARGKIWSQCCVHQSQVDAILQEKPTDRVLFLASILECEALIPSLENLTVELNLARSRGGQELNVELSKLWQDRSVSVQRLIAARWNASELRLEGLSDEEFNSRLAQVEAIRNRDDMEQQREQHSRQLDRRIVWKANDAIERQKLDESVKSLTLLRDRALAAEENARTLAGVGREVAALKLANVSIDNEIRRLTLAIEAKPVPPSAEAMDADEFETLRLAVAILKRSVELQSAGKSVCDTCGQSIKYEANLKSQASALGSSMAQLEQAEELRGKWSTFRKEHEKYVAALAKMQWQLDEEYAMRLKLLRDQMNADTRLAELTRQVSEEKSTNTSRGISEELSKQQTGIVEIATRCGTLESEIDNLTKQIEDLGVKLDVIPTIGSEAYMMLEESVALETTRRRSLAQCESNLAVVKAEIGVYNRQVRVAIERIRQQGKWRSWQGHLETALAALRPTAMPKAVLSAILEGLTGVMTEICRRLGLAIEIVCNENLELEAIHAGGDRETVVCLSGGQRACVAIAFWVARLLRVDSGLKLLVMDEPAANLDADAVSQLSDLLRDLGELAERGGSQIILTSHHQQLAGCGQYAISL